MGSLQSSMAASQGMALHNVMDWVHQDLSLLMHRAIVLCKLISIGTSEITPISRSQYAVLRLHTCLIQNVPSAH